MTDDFPPSFELNERRVMELFTGDRFYDSVDAALREAILNAIDACGRRENDEKGYSPEIEVIFDDSEKTVEVRDNGDGMDQDDLKEFFATIGSTVNRLQDEIEEGDYKAVGEFGIGVVSYFLVCNHFHVHTKKQGENPQGLEFTREMFDMETSAHEIEPQRDETGTTLILYVDEDDHYNRMLDRFSHWIRDVPYLTARRMPSDETIEQGGHRSHVDPVDIPEDEMRDWVEDAEIGPPNEVDEWKVLDGSAHVDVLYRGVFVQSKEVSGLWGLQGALHVDPKRFKPNLNREGFIDEAFTNEITEFLNRVHPHVLKSGVDSMKDALNQGEIDNWGLRKWVTIWMAVPRRDAKYSDAAEEWDNAFQEIKTFHLMEENDEREVSLSEIKEIDPDEIYLAPSNMNQASALESKAVSILRAGGDCVLRGVNRDNSFMSNATFRSSTTTDLLNQLQHELPQIKKVNDNLAESLINEHGTVAEIYSNNPRVPLVELGPDSVTTVRVGNEFWINVETEEGRQLVEDVCNRNEGYLGLLSACQTHDPDNAGDLIRLLGDVKSDENLLGPVKRQYLRRVIS